jgi:hypothetical protein
MGVTIETNGLFCDGRTVKTNGSVSVAATDLSDGEPIKKTGTQDGRQPIKDDDAQIEPFN